MIKQYIEAGINLGKCAKMTKNESNQILQLLTFLYHCSIKSYKNLCYFLL